MLKNVSENIIIKYYVYKSFTKNLDPHNMLVSS